MSKATTLQLAAKGAQDLYLTGNPQCTFFQSVIKRHTCFAEETIENYFDGNLSFGNTVKCKIRRSGDMISHMYLKAVLPKLQENQGENNLFTSWINSIGYFMIEYAEIQIGENVIDKKYGQWMYIWAELTHESSRIRGIGEMVGGKSVFTPASQNGPLELYIPLPFWFTKNVGSALPLISLQRQDVYVTIKFKNLNSLWVSNNTELASQIIPNNLEFQELILLVDYYFLDEPERRYFAQNSHYYLMEQVQIRNESIDTSKNESIIDINFNHPVKELLWVIQGEAVMRANQWDNFTVDFNSINPNPPLETALIRFEGLERFEEKKEKYFRIVIPWKKHTSVPYGYIYVYSFADQPEILQPTGSANFSRIDNPTLHLKTNIKEDAQVTIYALSYNILVINSGICGVMFKD